MAEDADEDGTLSHGGNGGGQRDAALAQKPDQGEIEREIEGDHVEGDLGGGFGVFEYEETRVMTICASNAHMPRQKKMEA